MQARSVATRLALLDAAVESLYAKGYGALTTNDIARRAGVSRGALLHHFPTKAELVAAAVEHVLRRRLIEFDQALDGLDPGVDVLDTAIDVVWSMFDGLAFVAWAELWVAARTDSTLAATMLDVEQRFTEESRNRAITVLSGLAAYDVATLALVRDFVFAVMNGVAFERLVPRTRRPAADYLAVLRTAAHGLLEATRATT
jgi:AcrR family transcriptional regulator